MRCSVALGAICVAFVSGCAATHFENFPLQGKPNNEERRRIDDSQKDRPQILVGISGGGSRAAALGWAVLRELSQYQYQSGGGTRRLVDDVTVVSSVSGGSVIAAYFGLYGPDKLDEFKPQFLTPDNMATLEGSAVNPITWFKLAISGASRIQVEEELFDRQVFHKRTFADLNQPGKPFIILNASDMASGEVFAFTPARFDDICSDFDQEPIAVGVAASAAFPIALTPVPFRNYSIGAAADASHSTSPSTCKARPIPEWITEHITGKYGPYLDVEEYKRARYANDLRHGPDNFRQIDYLYFMDGGLADNVGVHSLLSEISSPEGISGLLFKLNTGTVRRVVVLLINARSDAASSVSTSPSLPGIIDMVGSVTSVPIDATTASVNAQMGVLVEQLRQAARGAPPDALFGQLKVYSIQIDFDQLRGNVAEQKELRDKVKVVPTAWTISADDLVTVEKAGRMLLDNHPCFQRLLLDLGASGAQFVDRTFAETGCSP